MDNDNLRQKTFSGFLWRFAERCGAQGVSFIVSLVLARLLAPEVYGTIALVMVFMVILQVFVDSGMGNALIQKKDADDTDFSTVFYFNLVVCIVLYCIMFAAAPLIAKFYKDDSLTAVIRVLSLTLVISGVKNVQQAYVARNLLFKRFFFSTLGGTVGAAVLGITLAYQGFGVWSLVAQHIFNTMIDTIILWITVKWRPRREFSMERLKGLFSYGWKLLASALLDTVYNNIRQLIIGLMYSSANLAFYNKGRQVPELIITNVNTSIDSVLFPVLSEQQEDKGMVKGMTRRAIKTSTYIIAPLMMGLAATAPVVIRLLITEKWLPCVPFLRIFCFTFMLYPIHTANLNAMKAMGRSDIFLKLEIIKKVIGVILLLSTMWFGVMAMAYSLLVSCLLSLLINAWPNRKLLGYGYFEQLKDIFSNIMLAVLMGVAVKQIELLGFADFLTLCLQVVSGIVIYLAFSVFLKMDSFEYLWKNAKLVLFRIFRKR
ncbi:MAG: lipopolysaccharide biosynthesis protein [Lachnospiraceae bacterium]|nr:lipopolysaccharide biosynthesis protein [Lachnospiraceae bacterium]